MHQVKAVRDLTAKTEERLPDDPKQDTAPAPDDEIQDGRKKQRGDGITAERKKGTGRRRARDQHGRSLYPRKEEGRCFDPFNGNLDLSVLQRIDEGAGAEAIQPPEAVKIDRFERLRI